MQARGFLIGGTAGRTTLAGEGLQHQDGHSMLIASTIPNCVAYEATYGYELAVIVHNGLQRMFAKKENIFFYISVMNENYQHPKIPKDVETDLLKGMYRIRKTKKTRKHTPRVHLLGSGTILRESLAAAEMLEKDFGILSDVWAVTSFNELAREGRDKKRWNSLHPTDVQKIPYVTECLNDQKVPVIASTDYVRNYPEQIREFIPNNYYVLGTDGFGRSATRKDLRTFFEVDRRYIVLSAVKALVEENFLETKMMSNVIERYSIDPEKINPTRV